MVLRDSHVKLVSELIFLVVRLDRIDLPHPASVSLLCEFAAEERGDDLFHFVDAVLPAAKSENVRAIMFAGVVRQSRGITSSRPHTGDLVRRHCTADPRSVDENTNFGLPVGDRFGDGM